ncbi:MAG: hypothetical protein RR865_09895, partial [Clostridia bacterium]
MNERRGRPLKSGLPLFIRRGGVAPAGGVPHTTWGTAPAGGGGRIAEMAFRATGVGTAPHTGTNSFGAKEFAEN